MTTDLRVLSLTKQLRLKKKSSTNNTCPGSSNDGTSSTDVIEEKKKRKRKRDKLVQILKSIPTVGHGNKKENEEETADHPDAPPDIATLLENTSKKFNGKTPPDDVNSQHLTESYSSKYHVSPDSSCSSSSSSPCSSPSLSSMSSSVNETVAKRQATQAFMKPNILRTIFSFLDSFTICSCICSVCQAWKQITIGSMSSFIFHEHILSQPFSHSASSLYENVDRWKTVPRKSIVRVNGEYSKHDMQENINRGIYTEQEKRIIVLYKVMKHAHYLKSFSVSGCQHSQDIQEAINDDLLLVMLVDRKNMIFRYSHIQRLSLESCDHITEYGLQLITNSPSIVKNLKQLDFSASNRTIHDLSLEKNISLLVNLEELRLRRCHYVSDYGMNCLSQKLKQLTLIDISGCNNIKRFTWLKNCKSLRSLIVHHCAFLTDEHMVSFIPDVPNLTELDLNGCRITGSLTLPYMLAYLKHIQILNVSNSSIISFDPSIACWDAKVQSVLNSANSLSSLYFMGSMEMLTAIDLSGLSIQLFNNNWCRWEKLKKINLSLCSDVSNDSLLSLFRGLNNLESINLSWCQVLEDDTLEVIANSCNTNLRELILKHCSKLTPVSIQSIKKQCPNIHTLNLISTRTVTTSQELWDVITGMKNLTTLDITGCTLAEAEDTIPKLRQHIRRYRPNLHFFFCS